MAQITASAPGRTSACASVSSMYRDVRSLKARLLAVKKPAPLLPKRHLGNPVERSAKPVTPLYQCHGMAALRRGGCRFHPGGSATDDQARALAFPMRPRIRPIGLAPGAGIGEAGDRQVERQEIRAALIAADAGGGFGLPAFLAFRTISGSAICARAMPTMSAPPEAIMSSAWADLLIAADGHDLRDGVSTCRPAPATYGARQSAGTRSSRNAMSAIWVETV